MFHKLSYKLIFTIVTVSVIAVGIVGLLSSRVASIQLNRFLSSDVQSSLERFRPILAEDYRQHNGWQEVEPVLDKINSIEGSQLILLDPSKTVIAAAPPEMRQGDINFSDDYTLHWRREQTTDGKRGIYQYDIAKVPHIILTDERGSTIGMLCLIPVQLKTNGSNADRFINSINYSLVFSVLTAAVIALFFAVILSRRIVKPIEALTLAARAMEKGDLNQVVEIRSKDEIGDLAYAFNSMTKTLTLLEKQRSNMLNDITHELRTPLTGIRCQIEAIEDGLEHPTPFIIKSIQEEVMLLTRLIDDLQELALAEAGCLQLNKKPFSVAEEINQVLDTLKYQTESNRLSVSTSIQPELPVITGDPRRIGQVLRNILQNSIKHTPPDGKIIISARLKNENFIEIIIFDTGAGIPSEHLPYIFERFYRADSSRDRTTGGTGLGLAIVKHLIEAHGGTVRAKSPEGKGTEICLLIPIENRQISQ